MEIECASCHRTFEDPDPESPFVIAAKMNKIVYCEDCREDAEEHSEKTIRFTHPLYLIKGALILEENSSTHHMDSAAAIRNMLKLTFQDNYEAFHLSRDNMFMLGKPKDHVSQYEMVFVKCLHSPYPKDIIDFQNKIQHALRDIKAMGIDVKTNFLKRFCKIFVAHDLGESARQLLWKLHIDYFYYDGKRWNSVWTGRRHNGGKQK